MTRAAVFLDRDGVLNHSPISEGKPVSPRGLDDLVILSGVHEACAKLREAGFVLVVVTNQPEIARGTLTRETVDALNGVLAASLPLDEIVVCPHDDADRCECRKPKPGMLLDAARRHEIDLQKSYLVGDRWRDIAAGRAARVRTVFIDRSYDERRPENPDAIVSDLTGATAWILEDARRRVLDRR
jgi:D-glycero-D-manno-heptose 1,7-bisphosphate phosphatase